MQIGEVAAATGVSVRTLHHWHDVGLLVPSGRTASGYRSYDADDLERLQQVLTYRELGFALGDVKQLLDEPDVDVLDRLRRQQQLLADRIARLHAVATLVHRAVEARSMGIELAPHEIREVFGEHDPAEHADEARERWGDTDAYAQSHARTSAWSKQDWLRVKAEGEDVERRFAAALAAGLEPDDPAVTAIAEDHRLHISRRFYECSRETHVGLAELYVSDERFAAHYERAAPGLAQYVSAAVKANAVAP